jgi:DNA-binding HxlR family transcriptional regulator
MEKAMQSTKKSKRQSDCPINYTLEIISNRWAFLILRDIVYYGKHTYNEFLASAENVTTSMLADRLVGLERQGILQKTRSQLDRRKEIYSLTEKGLDMIPVLIELSSWGIKYDTDIAIDETLERHLQNNRAHVIKLIRETVQAGGSVYVGDNNVMQKLKT